MKIKRTLNKKEQIGYNRTISAGLGRKVNEREVKTGFRRQYIFKKPK